MQAIQIILVTASLAGVVLNIHHRRECFYVWAFTNAGWSIVDLVYGVWSQAALMMIYTGLSIWGILKWSQTKAESKKGADHG